MSDERQALYDVAVGNIENPLFEIQIDGEVKRFEGHDAKCFAFGMLAGLRSAENKCEFDVEIK